MNDEANRTELEHGDERGAANHADERGDEHATEDAEDSGERAPGFRCDSPDSLCDTSGHVLAE